MEKLYLGIDIGGTACKIGLINQEGTIIYSDSYSVNFDNYDTPILDTVLNSSDIFLDTYTLDFLDVPETVSERDLQKSIIKNLKNFILEIGKDFTFIGEEYRLQVGNHDYFVDLLL